MTLLEYVVNVRPRRVIILMHVNSRVQFLHHPSFEGEPYRLQDFFGAHKQVCTLAEMPKILKLQVQTVLRQEHKIRDKISDREKLNTNLTVSWAPRG